MATNWAYWAGFFDGEGCIELSRLKRVEGGVYIGN